MSTAKLEKYGRRRAIRAQAAVVIVAIRDLIDEHMPESRDIIYSEVRKVLRKTTPEGVL